MGIRQMLMDPAFLFRVERDPAGIAPQDPVSDHRSRTGFAPVLLFVEQHSRRSVARRCRAREAATRNPAKAQVRRMLADPRAKSLVTNFASEWLSLRVVEGVKPDPHHIYRIRRQPAAGVREGNQLVAGRTCCWGDRSVLELLNANYTFVNERLARHYGIPNVYGDQFRRVTVTDGIRGGLLGQGSILTLTSYPTRTSPVVRGKWILETLLGSPPPPPRRTFPLCRRPKTQERFCPCASASPNIARIPPAPVVMPAWTRSDSRSRTLTPPENGERWSRQGQRIRRAIPSTPQDNLPMAQNSMAPRGLRASCWSIPTNLFTR